MNAQKILKSKLIARDMCIGDSPEICAVRTIEGPSRISDTCVGCYLRITQKIRYKG